jgi:hypothetical protein
LPKNGNVSPPRRRHHRQKRPRGSPLPQFSDQRRFFAERIAHIDGIDRGKGDHGDRRGAAEREAGTNIGLRPAATDRIKDASADLVARGIARRRIR